MLAATLNTTSVIQRGASPHSSRDTAASENSSQPTPTAPEPCHHSPPSPLVSSFGQGSGSSTIEGSQTDSEASFHTASLSDPDLAPSPSFTAPAAQVEVDYNPEIDQPLDLSVVETFIFTAPVACVEFSRGGKYFAVAFAFDETHIYDVATKSKM